MIETAQPNDGKAILTITEKAGVFKPMETACVEELWNTYCERGEASGYHFLVFRDRNEVRGYACYGPHALTEGVFDLYWIAVDPAAQGRGGGGALMREVEARVVLRNGRLLLVETSGSPDYASARRFYESCGYHYQAVVHDFYAPGDDLIIFGKVLKPAVLQLQPA